MKKTTILARVVLTTFAALSGQTGYCSGSAIEQLGAASSSDSMRHYDPITIAQSVEAAGLAKGVEIGLVLNDEDIPARKYMEAVNIDPNAPALEAGAVVPVPVFNTNSTTPLFPGDNTLIEKTFTTPADCVRRARHMADKFRKQGINVLSIQIARTNSFDKAAYKTKYELETDYLYAFAIKCRGIEQRTFNTTSIEIAQPMETVADAIIKSGGKVTRKCEKAGGVTINITYPKSGGTFLTYAEASGICWLPAK